MQEIDIEYNLKGKIQYACGCKAQVLVYHGTHGKSSMKCPVCGKFSLFDFDACSHPCKAPSAWPYTEESYFIKSMRHRGCGSSRADDYGTGV